MLKITGLLALTPFVLLLSSCAVTESPPPPPPPVPPLIVQDIRPGMIRARVYHRLGDRHLSPPAYAVPGAPLEEREVVILPEGTLEMYFLLKAPRHADQMDPVTLQHTVHTRPCDRLLRFKFTNHVGWVLLYGWPDQESGYYYQSTTVRYDK